MLASLEISRFKMAIPLRQTLVILRYVLRQRLRGVERYPLVLMLEPLFRCNLACAGCGKIDYAEEILDRQLEHRRMYGGDR